MNGLQKWLLGLLDSKDGLIATLNDRWREVPFELDGGRVGKSPVLEFYKQGDDICSHALNQPPRPQGAAGQVNLEHSGDAWVTELGREALMRIAETGVDTSRPDRVRKAVSEVVSEHRPEFDRPEVNDFLESVQNDELMSALRSAAMRGAPTAAVPLFARDVLNRIKKNGVKPDDREQVLATARMVRDARPDFDRPDVAEYLHALSISDNIAAELAGAADQGATVSIWAPIAEKLLKNVNARSEAEPAAEDWTNLGNRIHRAMNCTRHKQDAAHCRSLFCSLIYCYWLDEGGLIWAAERLADRIENGLMRNTRPLQSIRVSEGTNVALAISKYTAIWQQGDLAAVDERRRQYHALYGFPLHVAARWGRLSTVDPRHEFPAVFHRFLAEAMRYYRDARNLQRIPDPQPALSALNRLAYALWEGNENLRTIRPPEMRGQMEYTKQLLGGYNASPSALHSEWHAHLPGRPGIRSAVDMWEFVVDTVAALYQWRRPGMRDYLTLAEFGEFILVMVRLVTDRTASSGAAGLGEGESRAFFSLMRDPIIRYASAYKSVARVDLLANDPFLGSPAEAMARHIQPPVLPPLRRSWATETPQSA